MIHELRIYHCMPGKIGDLNNRFANITLRIWEKHGIRQVGFWTVLIGPSNHALYYLLEWDSLAERERIWNAFAGDQEWIAARARTEAQGAIVQRIENYMLAPTAYSKIQ
ncbi:MAG: NIPSNAP family protein [Burkholderiales bacterium]|nr:NIPSNAP family protein [Burkholderiales bacterium]